MSRRGGDEGGRTKASKDSDAAAPSASPSTLAATTAAIEQYLRAPYRCAWDGNKRAGRYALLCHDCFSKLTPAERLGLINLDLRIAVAFILGEGSLPNARRVAGPGELVA